MKQYITDYMREVNLYLDNELDKMTASEIERYLAEFTQKISFFMHERLIHLIVTVLFALLEIMSILVLSIKPDIIVILLSVLFMVLLIPYVMHYYFLENSVQKMYKMRDKLIKKLGK